jgi:hypothetical protein
MDNSSELTRTLRTEIHTNSNNNNIRPFSRLEPQYVTVKDTKEEKKVECRTGLIVDPPEQTLRQLKSEQKPFRYQQIRQRLVEKAMDQSKQTKVQVSIPVISITDTLSTIPQPNSHSFIANSRKPSIRTLSH